MESLAEIMTRVERLAFAQEQEQSVSPPVLQLPSSAEQATLPLDLPPVEVSTSLEYIQAEAFLEVSGYFTPSSKRIKGIYTKEKKLREYLDEKGNKRTVKTKISANYPTFRTAYDVFMNKMPRRGAQAVAAGAGAGH